MEEFSLDTLKQISQIDAKSYITKYFIPLTDGNHAQLSNGKYDIVKDEIIKKVYLNRMSKEQQNYYKFEYTGIKQPVYKLNKPQLYDNKLNLCHPLPTPKLYSEISNELKDNVNLFLSYIKEVLCSNDTAVYNHLLKWLSNMVRGNKNNSAVVLKTEGQGVGKSTLPQFILTHVLPKELGLETGSEPIVSKFNSILGGKLFVSFEELETFSTGEWMAVSSRLKRMITSSYISLQSKNVDAFETDNINNYFILSNHTECVKDDEGRRYFVLDISNHRKNDNEYWKNIYNSCFNDIVGQAFYSYLYTIDLSNYDPQKYPDTKSKLDAIVKRLDPAFEFIKTKYILEKRSIYTTVSELYDEYKIFCISIVKKPVSKIDFNKKLSTIGINHYKAGDKNKFKAEYDTLLTLATNEKWLHELDDTFNNDEVEEEDESKMCQLKLDVANKRIAELEEQIKILSEKKVVKKFTIKKVTDSTESNIFENESLTVKEDFDELKQFF